MTMKSHGLVFESLFSFSQFTNHFYLSALSILCVSRDVRAFSSGKMETCSDILLLLFPIIGL